MRRKIKGTMRGMSVAIAYREELKVPLYSTLYSTLCQSRRTHTTYAQNSCLRNFYVEPRPLPVELLIRTPACASGLLRGTLGGSASVSCHWGFCVCLFPTALLPPMTTYIFGNGPDNSSFNNLGDGQSVWQFNGIENNASAVPRSQGTFGMLGAQVCQIHYTGVC
jgi:hypothetical protein